MDQFQLGTKIFMGGGLDGLLAGRKRVLVVSDKFLVDSGKVSYVTDAAGRTGAECRIFSDVQADPDISTVTAGVGLLLDFQPDAVIAFGGGSAIDAAKAILFFSAKQRDVREVLFAAIPTTSGTGSEVSRFAVITDREKEVKYPLVDDGLLPHAAVLDPVLTVSVPPPSPPTRVSTCSPTRWRRSCPLPTRTSPTRRRKRP